MEALRDDGLEAFRGADDASLLEHIQKKDALAEAAFAEAYRRYHVRLLGMLRIRWLGKTLLFGKEDVLQNVWIDLWEGPPKKAEHESLLPWLSAVAGNLLREMVIAECAQKRRPKGGILLLGKIDPSILSPSGASHPFEGLHEAVDIMQAIRMLSAERRVVIMSLVEAPDADLRDLARDIGISRRTFVRRLKAARRRIARALGMWEIFDGQKAKGRKEDACLVEERTQG